MVTPYDKAIASIVGIIGGFLATKWAGFSDATLQAAVVTLIGSALVFFVPNAKA